MTKVFVAYARNDHDTVGKVVRDLRDLGLDVYWDQDLDSGNWNQQLRSRVRRADHFVWMMSPSSVRSVEVSKEFGIASEAGALCHVIDLGGVDPSASAYEVAGLQWTPLDRLARLASSIERAGDGRRRRTVLMVSAAVVLVLVAVFVGPTVSDWGPAIELADLKVAMGAGLGVPDAYVFEHDDLSTEVLAIRDRIEEDLASLADPKILEQRKAEAEIDLAFAGTEDARMLEELAAEVDEGDILEPSDTNVTGSWRTRAMDVGSGREITFRIVQDQDVLRFTQKHQQVGLVVSGKGLITHHNKVRVWYRTITGASGELRLDIPGLIDVRVGPQKLEGDWDSGYGNRGRLVLMRQ